MKINSLPYKIGLNLKGEIFMKSKKEKVKFCCYIRFSTKEDYERFINNPKNRRFIKKINRLGGVM